MKRVILTGFDVFGPYKFNPTRDLAVEYQGKRLGDVEIVGIVLPATYYGAFEMLSEAIDRFFPDTILSTGLASFVPRLRLESVGRNNMSGKYADADGRKPVNQPLIQGGKEFYRINADNVRLANSLFEAGIPSDVSVDAETFICNSLIYLTAMKIEEQGLQIKYAHFHTPWAVGYLDRVALEPGKTTISDADLRKATEIIIRDLAKTC